MSDYYLIEGRLNHFIEPYYLSQYIRFQCIFARERLNISNEGLLEWCAIWASRGRSAVQILMRIDDFKEWVHHDCWYNEDQEEHEPQR